MKYDLNGLKEALDARIPAVQPDEEILRRALKRCPEKKPRLQAVRALTAAAACLIVLAVLGELLKPEAIPDDTGRNAEILAQGMETPESSPDPGEIAIEEDLDAYGVYSPDYARSILPDEAEFGSIVIRRMDNHDGTFVFEEKETGERVIPGQFDMAFAYFPATGTGLVRQGPNEGLTLVNALRETLGGQYSHFQYIGNGVAIVAARDEDETEPDPMYLISTADGSRLSRDYAVIGTMRSGERRLLLGHDNQELYGDFDVMTADGRMIMRVSECSGVFLDQWLAVQLPGEEEMCLIDFTGAVQLNGQRFTRVGGERDGYLSVRTDHGTGVLNSAGAWVFEPGRYLVIELRGKGLFEVLEADGDEVLTRLVDAQGKEVFSLRFELEQAIDRLGQANEMLQEKMGYLGYVLLMITALLLLRMLTANRRGERLHAVMTEAGFAAYVLAILAISHKNGMGTVRLWPTDTSVEGAYAAAWMFALGSCGLLVSLMASYPRLRRPKTAFSVGYAAALLPWIWKAVCADMAVADWSTLSALGFGYGALLAIILFRAKKARYFMEWCARFDGLNDYRRWMRIIWWAVTAAALFSFGAGCFVSGQEVIKVERHMEILYGTAGAVDEDWMEQVNEMAGEEQIRTEAVEVYYEREHMAMVAAGWLKRQGFDELTDEMVMTVRTKGSAQLRRPAQVWLRLSLSGTGAEQIAASAAVSGMGEQIEAEAVFLIPPGADVPAVEAWLEIRQRESLPGWLAAQNDYRAELGDITGQTE